MSDFNNQAKIRKLWVPLVSGINKERLSKVPANERFKLYDEIDMSISNKWVGLMSEHYNEQIRIGNFKTVNGVIKLNKDSCADVDQLLADAVNYILGEKDLL